MPGNKVCKRSWYGHCQIRTPTCKYTLPHTLRLNRQTDFEAGGLEITKVLVVATVVITVATIAAVAIKVAAAALEAKIKCPALLVRYLTMVRGFKEGDLIAG